MKILITGITGFVGRHVERHLSCNGYSVAGIARSNNSSIEKNTKIHLVEDIKTTDFNSITNGYDVVIHLAALVHQPNQCNIESYLKLNRDVTAELARACLGNNVTKFITISTSHVYEGLSGDIIESLTLSPTTPYAQSKYQATQQVHSILSDSSTSWYVIRPPLIYGKGVKGNLRSLSNMVSKLPVVPFKKANALRSYVSVSNVCDFILHIIKNDIDPGIYNISDDHDLSTYELCKLIAKSQDKNIRQLSIPKNIMRLLFTMTGKKDHYNKIYGRFILNIDKAIATGWRPSPIDYRDFVL